MSSKRIFPKEFVWGTATASYQIEGAHDEDGRTPSIWDVFSHTPGKVYEGHTGDIACDHYHRYKEDVKLLAELGIKSYRFSISWTRIFPERGKLNPIGIGFYRNLIQELRRYHIEPLVTIYHWDLPQYLQDEGGWTVRSTVDAYVEYATALFQELGDLVPKWITHNEPWCASFLSYGIGEHAPGHQDWHEATAAAHHLLLSHGKAVEVYRTLGLPGQIGITLNLTPVDPFSHAAEDVAAARRLDGFSNRWFLDPIFHGAYPQDMMELFESYLGHKVDFVQANDLQIISVANDFLGVNFYTRHVAKWANDSLLQVDLVASGLPVTDMGWEIAPDGLYELLSRLKREYTELPLYITENGAAFADSLDRGQVDDHQRIDYLREHFIAAHRFIVEGGNLQGYYVWSFLDNFEWAFGYSKRFGIVYVDYPTQERIPKASAKWYQRVASENQIV